MKMTQLFTRTSKTKPEGATAVSHELLVRAGFVHQEMAGVFSMLPLGLRVLTNIERIIREEMDAIGGQEVKMTTLQPKANWDATERWDSVDVLFKLKSRWSETEYAVGPTHEEIVFPLVADFLQSYKDLPIAVYQIQTKFRDEARAKSGVIRGREFDMKDMYSFHTKQDDLMRFYDEVTQAYMRVFQRCGIAAKITKASGGAFTKKYSHEFMAISDAGEDLILACNTCSYAENKEVSTLTEQDTCPQCTGAMAWKKSIEIGNIFDLGVRFAKAFNITYSDETGNKQFPYSGCYGIGTTRLLGSIVEENHDDGGIVWPKEVSPYDIHLVGLHLEKPEVRAYAEQAYTQLRELGKSVLFDDRADVRAGEKFADSDLIGIAKRVVVSEKHVADKRVEVKERAATESKIVSVNELA